MSCSDDDASISNGNADDMARFSRLHEGFREFSEILESAQFSTLSPGFTFGSNAGCGSPFVDIDFNPGNTTHLDLSLGACIEENFEGESYFVIYNYASLNNNLTLSMSLVFYGFHGSRPSGTYNLNCMLSDCDNVSLLMRITDSFGDELIHYHGMPNVLTVNASSNGVTASFDGLFYSDFEEDEPFNVAGTLVCCQ